MEFRNSPPESTHIGNLLKLALKDQPSGRSETKTTSWRLGLVYRIRRGAVIRPEQSNCGMMINRVKPEDFEENHESHMRSPGTETGSVRIEASA